jgi:regulator of nonsense transcripts 2
MELYLSLALSHSYNRLSELLYVPMPQLPTASQKSDSILIGTNAGSSLDNDRDFIITGGKWEDEEERRFFEDIQDLKDFVPSSVLGLEKEEVDEVKPDRREEDKEDLKKLEEELDNLGVGEATHPDRPQGSAREIDDR